MSCTVTTVFSLLLCVVALWIDPFATVFFFFFFFLSWSYTVLTYSDFHEIASSLIDPFSHFLLSLHNIFFYQVSITSCMMTLPLIKL